MSKVKKLKDVAYMADNMQCEVVPAKKERVIQVPPQLRWLCVKEQTFFRSGEFILQYLGHDGNWYEVPEVTLS